MDNVSTVCESIDKELDYNDVSSVLLSNLDSIPNKKNKFIDLIAFNETRLDSSITNSMIHLNDYDLIRKDRSRNGMEFAFTYAASLTIK